MQIHLSRSHIELLRQQVVDSVDAGESFVEEAIVCLSDEDLEAIEEMSDESPEEFFFRVYQTWESEESVDLIETLSVLLEDLDIELTYDVDDDSQTEVDDWDDDDALDDDDDEVDFEGQ